MVEDHDLVVAEQDRELRAGQAEATRATVAELGVGRQELNGAVEQTLRFQGADQMLEAAKARDAHPLHQTDGLVLPVVVIQHQLADLVGHLGQQHVALLEGQATAGHDRAEEDLDVDFVVRGVDARRVVDEVRIEQHAVHGRFDATLLRHAEVPALAHHLAA